MSLPAVLIRKSTGEIIKRALYPRSDMQPIVGLDPDLEWLLQYEPYQAPDYDSRVYTLNRFESITSEPHPIYSHLNQFLITYSTTRRIDSEIIINIENKETMCNESMLKYEKQLKLMALSIGVLFRNLDGMTLTTKEQTIKDFMMALATRIWKNDQLARDKIAEVTSGLEPNIDDPLWEKDE